MSQLNYRWDNHFQDQTDEFARVAHSNLNFVTLDRITIYVCFRITCS